MSQSAKKAYTELVRRVREAWLLESCASLLNWDESTTMPRRGAAHRGEQMALVARLAHQMRTDRALGDLLGQVESSKLVQNPDSDEAANAREIRRSYDRAVKVPAKLVEELARATTLAQQAWRDARKASDFAVFRPHLETIVTLLRQKAKAIGGRKPPYDALLDEYEAGMTAARVRTVFANLKADLVPLVKAIADSGRTPKREILEREFPIDRQRLFAESAAAALGFDLDAGRLDETAHPFCCTIGPGDCRLTTRYNAHHFNEAFFGVLHETGHGLYEQGLLAAHAGTPLGAACSMGIHESQSRLWENQVGRGRAFWEYFYPRTRQFFSCLRDVPLDDWLFAINDVRPSFIRVEADEATYNLHIILRFEIEDDLLTGNLAVADLPGAWNDKFRALLGLTPAKDSEGCLQDIHWSFGGMGYFPTYTLGNLYSAQFMAAARRDLGDLDADLRRGEFGRLKTWLNENIHRHGSRWRAEDLCRRVTGEGLNHEPLMAYLRAKYAEFYGV